MVKTQSILISLPVQVSCVHYLQLQIWCFLVDHICFIRLSGCLYSMQCIPLNTIFVDMYNIFLAQKRLTCLSIYLKYFAIWSVKRPQSQLVISSLIELFYKLNDFWSSFWLCVFFFCYINSRICSPASLHCTKDL